jgi:murein DD-endopeptidase MepM/ murein hydrolase activator NlpD
MPQLSKSSEQPKTQGAISNSIKPEIASRPSLFFVADEQTEVRYTRGFFELNQDVREINLSTLKSDFCFPLTRYVVYSKYGWRNGRMHTGVDLSTSAGDSIRCLWPGVVRVAKNYGNYGKIVVVHHYNGLETLYAHMSKIEVQCNQTVEQGELLGFVGRTGRATGNHLHLEIRAAGEHFDPLKIIDTERRSVKDDVMIVNKRPGQSVVNFLSETPTLPEVIESDPISSDYARKQAAKSSVVYHRVVKGDTLWGIAKRYKTTVAKICSLNGINSKSILSLGRRLRVK